MVSMRLYAQTTTTFDKKILIMIYESLKQYISVLENEHFMK
jgi:hypothetical protein